VAESVIADPVAFVMADEPALRHPRLPLAAMTKNVALTLCRARQSRTPGVILGSGPLSNVRVTLGLPLGNEHFFDDFLELGGAEQAALFNALSLTRCSISETASSVASVMPICSRL